MRYTYTQARQQTNRRDRMKKKHEIIEGVAGNGNTKWMVVTINVETGRYIWIEHFTSRAEAEAWLRSCC
jgi:hypothetical protein